MLGDHLTVVDCYIHVSKVPLYMNNHEDTTVLFCRHFKKVPHFYGEVVPGCHVVLSDRMWHPVVLQCMSEVGAQEK